jgi:hypothetical protein
MSMFGDDEDEEIKKLKAVYGGMLPQSRPHTLRTHPLSLDSSSHIQSLYLLASSQQDVVFVA